MSYQTDKEINVIRIDRDTENMKNRRISSLDTLRTICSLLVVIIHSPKEWLFGVTRPLEVIAVPIFFLLSGYLIYHAESCRIYERSLKSVAKLIKLIVGLNLLYWLALYPLQGNSLNSIKSVFQLIVWGRPVMSVLWFLTDMATGMLILALVYRLRAGRFLPFSLLLLPLSPILTGYLPLMGIEEVNILGLLDTSPTTIYHTLPVSLPYIYIGMMVAKHKEQLIQTQRWLIIALLALVGSTIEHLIFICASCPYSPWEYLFTPLLATAILVGALRYPEFGRGTWLENLGHKHSANIYYYHMLFVKYIPVILSLAGISLWYYKLGFIYVFILTLGLSMGIEYAIHRIRINCLSHS